MRTRGDTLWVFRRPALWCRLAQPEHRVRRLLSEFIGTAGFVSILSGGAAILARYGSDHALAPYQYAFILSCVSALFIVAAVYVPGDISAHFNPATTFAFALRGDMGWPMAIAYIIVQFAAAGTASLVARGLFGTGGRLAATVPPPGLEWKNASFIPLAVGVYIMAAGTAGGPFDGAAFNQGSCIRSRPCARRPLYLRGLPARLGDRNARLGRHRCRASRTC
jgi:glycerol uptake facilitator-like aquaporin